MEDKTPHPPAPIGQAEELTAAAWIEISLEPIRVEVARVPLGQAHPVPAACPDCPEYPAPARTGHPDELTSSAVLKVRSWPITVEEGGIVPAGETPLFISTMGMSAAGMAGVIGAVITVYVAASHLPSHVLGWFMDVAVGELALAAAVVFRIGRQGRSAHIGQGGALNRPQPVSPSRLPLDGPQGHSS